jgi:DNA-directed RNA polymerase subunit RPC12/RpoP
MDYQPPNVAVNCRSCGSEIPFVKPERPPAELSLKCPKCDRRLFYAAADVHPYSDLSAKRTDSSGPIGKKRWLFG